jgi:alkylhydroperoxidase/carboxymuconolactone decarboxylase family protein YurZ
MATPGGQVPAGSDQRSPSGDVVNRLRRAADDHGASVRAAAHQRQVRSLGVDDRTEALVRLAALVAAGAPSSAYRNVVEPAIAAGATVEELVGVLLAVAPTVGLSRVVLATPRLSAAIGYDVESALEGLDTPSEPTPSRTQT